MRAKKTSTAEMVLWLIFVGLVAAMLPGCAKARAMSDETAEHLLYSFEITASSVALLVVYWFTWRRKT